MVADLLVVGGGNMGTALVRGLLVSGRDPRSVEVAESDPAKLSALREALPEVKAHPEPVTTTGAVVAVKPGDAESACRALSRAGTEKVLSVMAGVRIERLEAWFEPSVAVVRAIPNTPALLGVGASALSGGSSATEADLSWAEEILDAVGITVRVSEEALDVVTGLSGSGPAYLFYIAESLIAAGVGLGLDEEVSRRLVLQTFIGSARLLGESGESPETLRARVTSPGGTTEAGLGVLANAAVPQILAEAVGAAARRSAELGR